MRCLGRGGEDRGGGEEAATGITHGVRSRAINQERRLGLRRKGQVAPVECNELLLEEFLGFLYGRDASKARAGWLAS